MSPAHIETSVWYCEWFQTEMDPSITPASTEADSRIRHPPSVTGKFLPPLVKVVIHFQCLKWLNGEGLNRTKASVYNTFWSLRAIFGFTFAGRCSNDLKTNLVHEILKQSKIKRGFIVYISKKKHNNLLQQNCRNYKDFSENIQCHKWLYFLTPLTFL